MPFHEPDHLAELIERLKKRQAETMVAAPAPAPAQQNAPYPSGQNRPKTYEEQLLEAQAKKK